MFEYLSPSAVLGFVVTIAPLVLVAWIVIPRLEARNAARLIEQHTRRMEREANQKHLHAELCRIRNRRIKRAEMSERLRTMRYNSIKKRRSYTRRPVVVGSSKLVCKPMRVISIGSFELTRWVHTDSRR